MNLSIRYWSLPLVITFACIVIASIGEVGREALQYLGPGAVFDFHDVSYRWISGHFTHAGWGHVGLNVLGLLSIWMLYGRIIGAKTWFFFLLLCAVGISLGFSFLSPKIGYYVGLSGVLHGMLAMAATLSLLCQNGRSAQEVSKILRWEEGLIIIGLWAKIMYEQTLGAVPLTESLSGDKVVVNAHLYGACFGTFFAFALRGYSFVKHKI